MSNYSTEYSSNYFNLIQQVGSSGKYQYIVTFIFSIQWLILGGLQLGPSILFITNTPQCQYPYNQSQKCINYICSLPIQQRKQFFLDIPDSLAYAFDNNFTCNTQILTILMSLIYLGCFFSNFVFSYFTDNCGRKYSLKLTWGCVCLGLILICISWNIYALGIGLFITGLGIQQTQSITLMIFYQQVDHKKSQIFCIVVQLCFCLGGLMIAGVYWKFPHWQAVIICVFAIPSIINYFVMLNFLEQTPRFLLKKQGIEATFNSLTRIAKINKVPMLLTIQDIQRYEDMELLQEKNRPKIRIWQLFKYKSLRLKTISLCMVFYCIVALYFGPFLIINQIGFNVYQNQIFLSLAQFITYAITILCVSKLPRKSLFISSFVICLIVNAYLAVVNQQASQQSLIQIGLVCFIRFFISMTFAIFLLYCNQLYPSATRGIGAGLYCGFGRLSNFASTFIIQSLQNRSPYYYFISCSIIGIIFMLPLKQTLNKRLKQQIQQFQKEEEKKSLAQSLTQKKRKMTL